MIDWTKGFVSKYYAKIVDPIAWRDGDTIDIKSGSINYTNSGVRGSADLECSGFDFDTEQWIRIYLSASQDGDYEVIPMFTGITSSPNYSYHGNTPTNKIQCFSPLTIADTIYLPIGWYAKKNANGAETIKELLSEVIPAPIVIEGSSPNLVSNLVAEKDETYLTITDKILDAIGWKLKLDGDGTIRITPVSSTISASFDHMIEKSMEFDIEIDTNYNEIPNVFRAVGDGVSAVAKDEDDNSRFSIQNRGREIWNQETSIKLNDGEKIGEYADRRLKELQKTERTVNYSRRYAPNVRVNDLISLNYPTQGLTGNFVIESQNIDLSYGAKVSEVLKG